MTAVSTKTIPVFDGHNDTILAILGGKTDFFSENASGHIDLPRAKRGGMAGGFFAVFVPDPKVEVDSTSPTSSPYSGAGDLPPMMGLEYAQNFTLTALGRLLRIDNVTAAAAVEAVLSVYPLDTFVDDSAGRMEIVGSPDEVPPVQQEVQRAVDRAEGKSWPMVGVERYAFYERAKQAYCVIQTGERRFYGCFAFRKGVVPPEGK